MKHNGAVREIGIADLVPQPARAEVEISVDEMARELGRAPQTVRQMLSEGIIPHDRRGKRYVVRRAVWENWKKGQGQDGMEGANAIAAALRAVLDGRVRVVVTFEPVGR